MSMWHKKLACLTVLGLAILAAPALGDDINPPIWRGLPGTTWQGWEFLTPNSTPLPDLGINENGDAMLEVFPGVGQEYWPEWGDRQGVWPLSGVIIVEVPNFPQLNPEKWIRVQLTWAEQAPGTEPIVTVDGYGAQATRSDIPMGETFELYPAGEFWTHSTFDTILPENPPLETIRIDGAVMVDELVIDTYCVPEPMSIGVLAIGSLLVLARKKR